jgi:hypothetical protein
MPPKKDNKPKSEKVAVDKASREEWLIMGYMLTQYRPLV